MFSKSKRLKVLALLGISLAALACVAIAPAVWSTDTACRIGLVWKRHRTEEAFAAQSGEISIRNLWNVKIPLDAMQVYDEQIFVTDRNCNEVVAYDLRSGDTEWSVDFGHPDRLAVNAIRNELYISGGWSWQRRLMAVDLDTSQKRWLNKSQDFKRIGITPRVLSDGRLVVFGIKPGPRLVNLDTGEIGSALNQSPYQFVEHESDWRWRWDGKRITATDFFETEVSWTSAELELPNGSLWAIRRDENMVVAFFSIIDQATPWDSPEKIVAFTFDDGEPQWEAQSYPSSTNVAVAGGRVYQVQKGMYLTIRNLSDGEELAHVAFVKDHREQQELDMMFTIDIMFEVYGDLLVVYFVGDETLSVYEMDSLE